MIDKLFKNVGKKIKRLTKVTFILEMFISIILGFAIFVSGVTDGDAGVGGLIVMIAGPIAAFVFSLMLYGFGEIIDKLCEIAKNTQMNKSGNFEQAIECEPKYTFNDIIVVECPVCKNQMFIYKQAADTTSICTHCNTRIKLK